MRDAIKGLLGSKKFLMAVLSIAAYIASRFGFELDQTEAYAIVSPLIAAIIGQGIAEVGKARPPIQGIEMTTTGITTTTTAGGQ